MPFCRSKTLYYRNIPKEVCKERSMVRSIFKSILPSHNISLIKSKRASAFTSLKGSITVEASMAVPIFFFAVLCLLYLMEMMAVQTSVRSGLQFAGKEAATEAAVIRVVSPASVKSDVINAIGAERLERSIVQGGSSGIDCSGSRISPLTGIGQVSAKYKIKIPVPLFHIAVIPCEETLKIKAWTGYEKAGFHMTDDEIVYVTETGLVYHRDYNCTHLDLSIRMVGRQDVAGLRNHSGGKYHACERCGGAGSGGVYITDTGNRYHSSLSCSGLKRTVYAVHISEVAGKGACSKCGK